MRLHLLLVEDNRADVVFFQEALVSVPDTRVSVTHVETLQAARAAVGTEKYDGAVLDLGLPDSEGIESYVALQQVAPALPIIVLTGLHDEEVAERALQRGAQDYLKKGEFTGEVLLRAIRYAISRKAAEVALRESEARYRQLHQELERRVEARTRELREKQAQLVQAAKLASIGELASGVAHELNNPLNNIALFIGNAIDQIRLGMEGRQLQRPLLERLMKAEEQIRRAADVIAHLKTFARQQDAARRPVSINAVVERSVDFVREEFRQAQIQLDTALTPHAPVVLGRATQLEQVLLNLYLNARDAVRSVAHKRIRVATQVCGDVVELQVEDTGIGISADVRPRIFDPFFTTKEVGEGAGLGLSIAYGIVAEHDGQIEIESRSGLTRFYIRLPRYSPS